MKLIMKSISIFIIFMIFLASSESPLAQEDQQRGIEIISVQQASKLIEENNKNPEFVILDVRTKEEYTSGHIKDSLNIDYKSQEFKQEVEELDKEKIYLSYCRSGRRSANASAIMNELGFENIYMIEGGIVAWKKAKLPVTEYQP